MTPQELGALPEVLGRRIETIVIKGPHTLPGGLHIPIMFGGVGALYYKDDDPIQLRCPCGQWWTVGWHNGQRVKMKIRQPLYLD